MGVMGVLTALACAICAGTVIAAWCRATFNPLVQGSTPWRPTRQNTILIMVLMDRIEHLPVMTGLSAADHRAGRAVFVNRRAAGPGRHRGKQLGDIGLDQPLAGGSGDGDPVVAVDHEMAAVDAVDLDRRDRFTAPLGQRQPLPPEPHPVGGGPEAPVEVAARLCRADDGVQPDRLPAQLPLATPARRVGNLIQRYEPVAVTAPARRRCASAARTWCRLARRKSYSTSTCRNPVSLIVIASVPATPY